MKCQTHKKYKGVRKPRTLCDDCWDIYLTNKHAKDGKVTEELEISDESMMSLMMKAHEKDITVNELIEIILRESLSKLEKMTEEEKKAYFAHISETVEDPELEASMQNAIEAVDKLTAED